MASEMTISMGLRKVSRLKGDLAKSTARAAEVVSWSEDHVPSWKFEEVMAGRKLEREMLITLETAIARANALTVIEFRGRKLTLTEAIRRLQELKGERPFYERLNIRTVPEERTEYGLDKEGRGVHITKKVVWVSAISVVERDALVRGLADEFEELNGLVERANHSTVLEWLDPAAR